MENSSKTIRIDIDEKTSKRLEHLKNHFSKENHNGVSVLEMFKNCLNFIENNINKKYLNWEQLIDNINNYVKTAYLIHLQNNRDLKYLDDILTAIERTNDEYYPEEINELAALYNEDEPMTVGRLVRFKHRITPTVFLKWMGESEEEFEHLSNDELANFIMRKFENEEFRIEAKRLFYIQC